MKESSIFEGDHGNYLFLEESMISFCRQSSGDLSTTVVSDLQGRDARGRRVAGTYAVYCVSPEPRT